MIFSIPEWGEFEKIKINPSFRLEHGYDENKPDQDLEIKDLQEAAKFRGGKCRSEQMIPGDLHSKLKWECAFGHQFSASPYLIIKAGHWCPICDFSPQNFPKIALNNPFFAQVWRSIPTKVVK